jgi:6-phosphogluconolactonase
LGARLWRSLSDQPVLRTFETADEASRAVGRAFAESVLRAVRARGRCAVALAGGQTPRRVYRTVADEHRDEIPWEGLHLFWSDERYVALDDPESNYRMAVETLLSSVPVPRDHLHVPDTSLSRPEEAAERYENDIRAFFGPESPQLDWTFLGLGEDGHVASLFPGSDALLAPGDRLVLPVFGSAKPPPVRLTMTLDLINQSREIHFLVFGRRKREILRKVLEGDGTLPAQRVAPIAGAPIFWADREAAPG